MSALVSLSRFFTTSGPRPFSLDFPQSVDDNLTVDSDATDVEQEHSQSTIKDSEIREHLLSSIQMASPKKLRALVLQLADEIPEVQWFLVHSLTFPKALPKEALELLHVDARSDADSDEACCSSGSALTDPEITRCSSPPPSDARSSCSWKTARSVNGWDINMEDVPEIQSEVSVDVRSCPRWDICVNCGKTFDMNAVRGPFECCYHPGKPDIYYRKLFNLNLDFPRE
ncbi:hypothetical protein AZE42_09175 [Rhizopogon vesiculosus]|uniref:C2H2-type domain-containing protein n=1 Tax=Rhizopogon vesiculosus TaxID=180088 RepID=A0A1J8R5P3_9AGAM|nr:hypothetical protein AZE42_09175 [Rhizopogon vesiculosus]